MRARDLIPTLLVVALAVVVPLLEQPERCPAGTDGPQYACWLEQHG